MPTYLFILIFLLVIAGIVAIIALLARPRTGPTKRERELENLVDNLRELAYDNRDVEPDLSFKITDAIKKFNQHDYKELS